MRRFVFELLLAAMLVVTSADLLYLYLDGAWYDPNKVIEVSEVVLLGVFICLSIFYIIYRVRKRVSEGI